MKLFKKFELSDNTRKLNKIDWIIMGVMVLIYGIISFIRLGDTVAPNTYYTFNNLGDEVVVSLTNEYNVRKLRYYTGYNLGEVSVLFSLDGINYNEEATIKIESVFSWQEQAFNAKAKYIKFVCNQDGSTLGDIVLYGDFNNVLPVVLDEGNPLLDEMELAPKESSYMNSTYFDEIYYARTAYEYIHGIDVYEWTHPPLGKLLMAIPVAIFGFSPFTYRLMGNLFGIMLIPIMYILAKRIFKNRKWAILAGLVMMFDNFHFVHTRIALIDGYQVVFILLSVLFMKEYIDLKKDDVFKKKAIYLLLSGLFIGCAIATKWNALYVGLGLAITFFVHLFREYHFNIIKFVKKSVTINRIIDFLVIFVTIPLALHYLTFVIIGKTAGKISLLVYFFVIFCFILVRISIALSKDKNLMNLMFVCIVSFIILPVVIYSLSYLLFPGVGNYDGTLKGILNQTSLMYNYHANLDATHPFSSSWYNWPLMTKPVWLYTGGTKAGLYMTISDIGNPAIWWTGILGFVYLVIDSIKNKNSIFILIFILSTFIPYIFIGRLMFMYHYFITLPFVMLGIVSLIKWITEKIKSNKAYYAYVILIIIVFMIFYPITSGLPVKWDYVNSLKWLSGWYF
jgi:hypothetical protein